MNFLNSGIFFKMKNLLYILILIFLSSCTTPEEKIMKSFNEGRYVKRHENTFFFVKDIKIYDTIYLLDVYEGYGNLSTDLYFIDKRMKRITAEKNKLQTSDTLQTIKDSLIAVNIRRLNYYEKQTNDFYHAQSFHSFLLNAEPNDSVAGYYVKITTNLDTLYYVVTSKFNILCPVFMYKTETLTRY